jgi:hypothetical protein
MIPSPAGFIEVSVDPLYRTPPTPDTPLSAEYFANISHFHQMHFPRDQCLLPPEIDAAALSRKRKHNPADLSDTESESESESDWNDFFDDDAAVFNLRCNEKLRGSGLYI